MEDLSYETDFMTAEQANKFQSWFDQNIGTDCYRYGSPGRFYFVCLEMSPSELRRVEEFEKANQ